MKPLGTKKTRTRVKDHQNCSVCHPDSKGGRAAEKRAFSILDRFEDSERPVKDNPFQSKKQADLAKAWYAGHSAGYALGIYDGKSSHKDNINYPNHELIGHIFSFLQENPQYPKDLLISLTKSGFCSREIQFHLRELMMDGTIVNDLNWKLYIKQND